jgi:hypothetical protein
LILTKREQTIVVVSAACVGLLLLFWYVIEPLMDARDLLVTQRLALQTELDEGRRLIKTSRDVTKRWADLRAAGLSGDPSAAESTLHNSMQSWSASAGLSLVSIRPDRTVSAQGLRDLTFQTSADGSMRSIVGFLYRVETAKMPARIHELQIASRTDGADDLSMQLHISTLCEESRAVKPTDKPREQP